MPYITKIEVVNHYRAKDFVLELPGEQPQHLFLTGPNGAGKTTILMRLAADISQTIAGNHNVLVRVRERRAELRGSVADLAEREKQVLAIEAAMKRFMAGTWWNAEPATIKSAWQRGDFVAAVLPADRAAKMSPVKGPSNTQPGIVKPGGRIAAGFHQYLVDQNVQARLAEFEDKGASRSIFAWLARLEEQLSELFEVEDLKLVFDRSNYQIGFAEPGGQRYNFDQLAAGHASLLEIVAELILRTANPGGEDRAALTGVVLIDEPGLHLHPSLQEKVMPLLTGLFPRLQFIVATHSPAIICSIDNAIVFDLETQERTPSEELRGVPYGDVMVEHFGIETPYDLETTAGLKRLKQLADSTSRSPAEDAELEALAKRLSRTNHPLALMVWNELLEARLAQTG